MSTAKFPHEDSGIPSTVKTHDHKHDADFGKRDGYPVQP